MSLKKYHKPEIESLKGIAVILIILYNADLYFGGVRLFQGGFLGIDILFLISGYLMTLTALRETTYNNHFSIKIFLKKRRAYSFRLSLPQIAARAIDGKAFMWSLSAEKES